MRTVATFESSAWSTAPERDDPGVAAGARQLAVWLAGALRARGHDAEEIIREDFGCALRCRIAGERHDLVIGLIPGGGGEADRWFVCVERATGLLATLLGARRRVRPGPLEVLHAILRDAPAARVRWHARGDFAQETLGEGAERP